MTQSPIEKAKEVLRPFARVWDQNGMAWTELQIRDSFRPSDVPGQPKIEDYRRAREALKALEGE